MRVAQAFSPGGISSLFAVRDRDSQGLPIKVLDQIGALGGGFVIKKGVTTRVEVCRSRKNSIKIVINNRLAPEAMTTRAVVNKILSLADKNYNVRVKHKVDIPIGAGFGASGAGALSTALALSRLFNLPLSYNQIGMIAHHAEIEAKTGLGTVAPLMIGGCVLSIKPGGPGIAVIDRILTPAQTRILAIHISPIYTKSILGETGLRERINTWGEQALTRIQRQPTLETFFRYSLQFAKKLGLITPRLRKVIRVLQDEGAIGVTQNMVGEAAHAAFMTGETVQIAKKMRRVFPSYQVLISDIDQTGVRLIEE
ncbi:pantoate kinase [[Eubacterium] cellulosolvens]